MIHATKGIQLFNTLVDLNVMVEKIDDQTTRINITATSFKLSSGNKDLDEIEVQFVETIYKFF